MSLPTTNNIQTNSGSEKQLNSQSGSDGKSLSPNSSPRGSPRPSPRSQHKRDHSRSDIHLSTSYRESQVTSTPNKSDVLLNSETNSISNRSELSFIELSRSGSHESTASTTRDRERKEQKAAERPKKKSSWYNVLYPTYKSRSEDFKRIFKDVPDDERLVVGAKRRLSPSYEQLVQALFNIFRMNLHPSLFHPFKRKPSLVHCFQFFHQNGWVE